MKDTEAQTFLSRLATTFREVYKDEREGWLEWLLTGFVELDLATEVLESLSSTRHFPRLPAFRALYNEFHKVRDRRAARGKRFPECGLCRRRGTIHYVRGGFSAKLTRPIHKDRPKNFPYLTDTHYTFCSCAKGKSLFLEDQDEKEWQNHVNFVYQVGLGGDIAVTGRFMDACRKLPMEDWETWQGILGSFKDLPLADTAGAGAKEELLNIPM